MDEVPRVSLPPHFWGWDVQRAATLRVLGRLWEFCDREADEAWCFHADAQLIESCGLGGDRQLRRCLNDLREARLVQRENAPDGRLGFRLFNREPYVPDAGQKCPDTSVRTEVSAQPVKSVRPAGQKCPPHLVREQKSRGAEEQNETQILDPTREERWSIELETELLELQTQTYRTVGERLGKADLHDIVATPGTRHAIQARMLEGYTADMLRKAMRARGRTGGGNDFRYLGNASAWSPKAVEFALGIPDDEEAKHVPVAEEDGFIPEL